MKRLYLYIISIFFIVLGFCNNAIAAEVLQVTSSSKLLIGDNNRTYNVRLSCIDVSPEKEEIAFNWLKHELPRHTHVNLRPTGSNEGILLARVINLSNDIDISQEMNVKGLSNNKC